ncbi:hypothetical protein MUK42_04242 [Musa troglodytarum]|uniref:Uncharacterized protein n=1 Tax=Musa troglodytarum TaxID=320322 RepID=A0A9E7GB53_9LILI|nr:hypothetical protein MUK42_04242 [Musa troglodytarum]
MCGLRRFGEEDAANEVENDFEVWYECGSLPAQSLPVCACEVLSRLAWHTVKCLGNSQPTTDKEDIGGGYCNAKRRFGYDLIGCQQQLDESVFGCDLLG